MPKGKCPSALTATTGDARQAVAGVQGGIDVGYHYGLVYVFAVRITSESCVSLVYVYAHICMLSVAGV